MIIMTYYEEILKVLAKEGPLNARKISQLTGAEYGTVRHYLMYMNRAGQVRLYKGMRGMYEITDQGRLLVKD